MPGIVYQVETVDGIPFIVIDPTLLSVKSHNLFFEEYRQANGDIYLKLVNVEKRGDLTGSNSQTNSKDDHYDLQDS